MLLAPDGSPVGILRSWLLLTSCLLRRDGPLLSRRRHTLRWWCATGTSRVPRSASSSDASTTDRSGVGSGGPAAGHPLGVGRDCSHRGCSRSPGGCGRRPRDAARFEVCRGPAEEGRPAAASVSCRPHCIARRRAARRAVDALGTCRDRHRSTLILAVGVPRGVAAVMAGVATVTAFARVHQGAHWPSEAVAGCALGTAAVLALKAAVRRGDRR